MERSNDSGLKVPEYPRQKVTESELQKLLEAARKTLKYGDALCVTALYSTIVCLDNQRREKRRMRRKKTLLDQELNALSRDVGFAEVRAQRKGYPVVGLSVIAGGKKEMNRDT